MTRRTGDKVEINGDYQYNAYYTGKAAQRFWHYAKLKEAEDALEIKSGDNILDVGCGSGLFSHFLAEHEGTHVTAIDANHKAIEFAKNKYSNSNIEFKLGLLDELNLKKTSYDKIAFLEVKEHISIEQGSQIMKEFSELLKPGGMVVISTPNRQSLWPLIEWALDFFKLVPNLTEEQHEYLYAGNELKHIGEKAGLTLHKKHTINAIAPWLAMFSWSLALRMHRIEMKYFKKRGSILLYTFVKPK